MGPFTKKMIELAHNTEEIKRLRVRARQLDPEYPHNGCASLMSALIERALLAVGRAEDFAAHPRVLELANEMKARGWKVVPLGQQQSGDIAITKNDPHTGRPAHTFLLIEQRTADKWLILDNQNENLHTRSLSGKDGKTAVAYYLRSNA